MALVSLLIFSQQIPVKLFEECYANIIPHIVADFVLADSVSLTTSNTLLVTKDLAAEGVLLGTGYQVSNLSH